MATVAQAFPVLTNSELISLALTFAKARPKPSRPLIVSVTVLPKT